jgi:hypothetical protein
MSLLLQHFVIQHFGLRQKTIGRTVKTIAPYRQGLFALFDLRAGWPEEFVKKTPKQ